MNFMLCFVLTCAYQYIGAVFVLPGQVYPKHYDITLLYDIDPSTNFSFFGAVDIMLKTRSETSKIFLFAKDIKISTDKIKLTSASYLIVVNDDAERVKMNDVVENVQNNYYTVHLANKLLPNDTYFLYIPFSGNLGTKQSGVYVRKYFSKHTQKVEYYVKTNFEPTNARQCFPSFDEPQYKATFTLTLGHHMDYRAVSNMALSNTSRVNALNADFPWHVVESKIRKPKSSFLWDDFKISKPMSTHQLAFMISKYSNVKSSIDVIFNSSVWTRPEVIDQAPYVISASLDIVSFYEQFFGVSYPLPKLEHVFEYTYVPDTGYGLVSYPESLLFNGYSFRKDVKLELVNAMSNQIVHQWFGNLVTLRYWSENWVKEGFALFMAHLSSGTLLLGKNIRGQDITSDNPWMITNYTLTESSPDTFVNLFETVLEEDALPSTKAMALPLHVTEPSDIIEVQNVISNYKAAILFRMLYRIMGEKLFKEALHKFLMNYTYKTFIQYDLWAVMDEFLGAYKAREGLTAKTIINSWTRQPGYPLLTAIRNYNTKTISINQYRFLSSDQQPDKSSWWIPLVVMSRDDVPQDQLPVQWLVGEAGPPNSSEPHLFEHGARADEWLVLNAHALALYRVNYDVRNWQMLSMTLRSNAYSRIPPLSRAQLLSDSLALAKKGLIDYTIALRLAKYLEHEDDSAVLRYGLRQIMTIETMFRRTPDYEVFQKYVRLIVEKPFMQYDGLKTQSHEINNVLLQKYLSKPACDMNVARCLNDAVTLFRKWMETKDPDGNNPIPIDLRDTVYCWGVALGTTDQWRFILNQTYNASTSEMADLLNALACTREASLMHRTINVLTSNSFNDDALFPAISALMRNPVGFYVSSGFLYQKTTVFFSGNISINIQKKFIREFTKQFISQDELNEFLSWHDANLKMFPGKLKPTINLAIDFARDNLAWIKKYRKTILSDLILLSQDQGGNIMVLKTSKSERNSASHVLTKLIVIFACYSYILRQITCYH